MIQEDNTDWPQSSVTSRCNIFLCGHFWEVERDGTSHFDHSAICISHYLLGSSLSRRLNVQSHKKRLLQKQTQVVLVSIDYVYICNMKVSWVSVPTV